MNEVHRALKPLSSDLPYDSELAIASLSRSDERLGFLIQLIGDYEMDYRPTLHVFEALCRSITAQQLSGKAAATIYGRFCDLLPENMSVRPEAIQALSVDAMRSVGLSRAKTTAIQDLAKKTLDGVVPAGDTIHELPDEEIMDRLTSVRGIGPWTVEMLMMFRLGRPDVLPATDLGIRKGFAILYDTIELPGPKSLLKYGERWRPFRTVASWYLWRVLDLAEGALPPP